MVLGSAKKYTKGLQTGVACMWFDASSVLACACNWISQEGACWPLIVVCLVQGGVDARCVDASVYLAVYEGSIGQLLYKVVCEGSIGQLQPVVL